MHNKPTQIIVHHDGVSRDGPSFGIINEYHRTRGFPISSLGYYVGYHFLIERDGQLKAARLLTDEGAHTKGQNFNSIGICLAGNFDVEMPTVEQKWRLGELISVLLLAFPIADTDIYPHRHYAEKSCYGDKLSDTWARRVYLEHEHARIESVLAQLPTN